MEDHTFMDDKSHVAHQASVAMLMPKRISSSKNRPQMPVKKIPKDRSSVIGLKRTRKSRD